MSLVFNGEKAVWGIPARILPVKNAPPGRKRLRFRRKETAYLFVKDAIGIRKFILKPVEDHWEAGIEVGRNLTLSA
jgi:hypothetical protein